MKYYKEKCLKCHIYDIDYHYSLVKNVVEPNTDKNKYIKLMKKAVKENTAFKTEYSNCFIYYIKNTKYCANGVSFYAKNSKNGLISLLDYVLCKLDILTKIIKFIPHNTTHIKTYKKVVSLNSIKMYYQYGTPLVIQLDYLRKRINTINSKVY